MALLRDSRFSKTLIGYIEGHPISPLLHGTRFFDDLESCDNGNRVLSSPDSLRALGKRKGVK